MTIGEKLKRERKKQGFDLDSVAKETKIAKMFLIAIEEDDLSSLPGGVYTRNFLRAYAKYLDLDEDIITAEYHEQYEVKPHFVIHQEQTKQDDLHFKKQRWRFLMTIFFLLLVAAAAVLITYYFPFWKTEISGIEPAPEIQTSLDRDEAAKPAVSGSPSNSPSTPEPSKPDAGNKVTEKVSEAGQAAIEKMDETSSDTSDGVEETLPDAPVEPAAAEAEPERDASVRENVTPVLPLTTMVEVREFCASQNLDAIAIDQEGVRIEDVFAIEALGTVDIEVYVDGNMATRRQLKSGQVRFYRYGNYNRVIIGDISMVNLQDGKRFFSGADLPSEYIFLPDFEPAGFLEQLHNVMNDQNQ